MYNLIKMILFSAGQDYTIYLSDGLHLSEKGNQFVAQHLWGLLERRLADLPFILPYWGDVDAKSPESSLLCYNWRRGWWIFVKGGFLQDTADPARLGIL